jgi:hypothetical protein
MTDEVSQRSEVGRMTGMNDLLVRGYLEVRALGTAIRQRVNFGDERGEGVISAAIAVLIMAFIGALMWVAFRAVFTDASDKVRDNVNQIGG